MNNSINFSGFVDMVLDSTDDFEPYGYAEFSGSADEVAGLLGSTGVNRKLSDDFSYD